MAYQAKNLSSSIELCFTTIACEIPHFLPSVWSKQKNRVKIAIILWEYKNNYLQLSFKQAADRSSICWCFFVSLLFVYKLGNSAYA